MSSKLDSESERQFRRRFHALGVSLEISLFSVRGGCRKTAPATTCPAASYKKTLVP
jgi:hypothetical protein